MLLHRMLRTQWGLWNFRAKTLTKAQTTIHSIYFFLCYRFANSRRPRFEVSPRCVSVYFHLCPRFTQLANTHTHTQVVPSWKVCIHMNVSAWHLTHAHTNNTQAGHLTNARADDTICSVTSADKDLRVLVMIT